MLLISGLVKPGKPGLMVSSSFVCGIIDSCLLSMAT